MRYSHTGCCLHFVAAALVLLMSQPAAAGSPVRLSGTIISTGDVVTISGRRAPFTPNGQTVLFTADRLVDSTIELWSVPAAGGTPSRRSGVFAAGGSVTTFKISPDGNWVAYAADPTASGQLELFLAPVTGASPPVNLSQSAAGVTSDIGQFDFTLNSANVLFIADRIDDGVAKNELWTVPIVGGTPTKLSGTTIAGGDITSFSISPNRNTVVFRGDRAIDERFELWATAIGGGTISNVSGRTTGTRSVGTYEISPDSARLVFIADYDTATVQELYSAPLGGGSRVKISGLITPANGDIFNDFIIASNSKTVVFRADKEVDNRYDAWSVPIAGGSAPVKLSNADSANNIGEVLVTSDAQRVVFAVGSTTTIELWSVPIGRGTATLILPDTSNTGGYTTNPPKLSPDGTRVVFGIDRETAGLRELWSVAVTGGPVVKLSPPIMPNGGIATFSISEDSKRVIMTTESLVPDQVELWSAPITGGPPTRISGETLHASTATATLAALSPDSQFALFTMDRATSAIFELWINRIDGGGALLDIDGDGKVLAGTDLLILTRWQLGVRGNALFAGALGAGATRNTAALIEAYLGQIGTLSAP